MTIEDRAEFLAWLRGLDQQALAEVQTLVSSMISAHKAFKLRHLFPGMEVVFSVDDDAHVGTVVKTNKVSALVLDQQTRDYITVHVDNIQGVHISNLEFVSLEEMDSNEEKKGGVI